MKIDIDGRMSAEERTVFEPLTTPFAIQAFLDTVPYSAESRNRSPLNVLRDRTAHCLDGGLLGVMALRRLGRPPLVLQMLPEPGTDDDHILAVFKENGCFGALAKSNFVGLRFREPVYRSVRELVMSYFDCYFNVLGQKTLRAYTRPFNLAAWDRYEWMWTDEGVDAVERLLPTLRSYPAIGRDQAARLSPMDELSYRGHLVGVNQAGLYRPK